MRRLAKALALLVALWLLWLFWPAAAAVAEAPIRLAQGAVTAIEMHNLKGMVDQQCALNGAPPSPAAFSRLLATEFDSAVKDPAEDIWGRPYYYRLLGGGAYEIISAGPDRRPGTPDDIRLKGQARS